MNVEPLAPSLGRIAMPPGRDGWDRFRMMLLDRLVAGSNGSAGDPVAAWREVVNAMAEAVSDLTAEDMAAAAAESRYPGGRIVPDARNEEAHEIFVNRLVAAGIPLERLGGDAGPAATGAAAEAAWEEARKIADAELRRWRMVADRIADWRRPWWPLVAGMAILWSVILVPAAWLGGLLAAPSWWEPVGTAFWNLPWP